MTYFSGSATYVDDVVVQRVLNGGTAGRRLTIAERRVVTEKLFFRGLSAREVAELAGISQRAVARHLQWLNLKESDRNIHPWGRGGRVKRWH